MATTFSDNATTRMEVFLSFAMSRGNCGIGSAIWRTGRQDLIGPPELAANLKSYTGSKYLWSSAESS
jgi:hypothetical protein